MTLDTATSKSLGERLADVAQTGLDLSPYLTTVDIHVKVEETQAVAHCHHIALDGSTLPRLQDFTDEVANWLLDYVTPRTALMESSSGSPREVRLKQERLRRDAIATFKRHGMSGEQGEMLLFVLAENFLKLPQLLCKMDLKTDPEMHFHGLDGIHCGGGNSPEQLAVYWCESKVHKDLDNAISEALDGLKPFFHTAGVGSADKRRELVLLDRYMDLADDELQTEILEFINPKKQKFNTVSWRGLCLIGYDYEYPTNPNSVDSIEFTNKLKETMPTLCSKLRSRLKNRNLENVVFHTFYMPFGFCEEFRKAMHISLGIEQ